MRPWPLTPWHEGKILSQSPKCQESGRAPDPFHQSEPSRNQRGSTQDSSAHCCLRQKLLFLFIQMGEMQHVRALQTNCSSQTRGSVYGRVQQSVRRCPLWALPVGVGVAQVRVVEGQASSLGEALVTVHTCRPLLQPR